MPIIAVTNLKGGVGKTSTCFHLGGVLAQRGRKVLVVDNDSQSSLTQLFWGPKGLHALPRERSIDQVYSDEIVDESVIHPTGFDNLHLLPGHRDVIKRDRTAEEEWHEGEESLKDFLDDVRDDYDYVLIDTRPSLDFTTHAALIASDWVLVPLQPEDLGTQGIFEVNQAIAKAQKIRGGPPTLLGYLISQYNRQLAVHQKFHQLLRNTYKQRVMLTTIPNASAFKEAVVGRTPICHFKKKSAAHEAVGDLANEIELRILTNGNGEIAA